MSVRITSRESSFETTIVLLPSLRTMDWDMTEWPLIVERSSTASPFNRFRSYMCGMEHLKRAIGKDEKRHGYYWNFPEVRPDRKQCMRSTPLSHVGKIGPLPCCSICVAAHGGAACADGAEVVLRWYWVLCHHFLLLTRRATSGEGSPCSSRRMQIGLRVVCMCRVSHPISSPPKVHMRLGVASRLFCVHTSSESAP